MRSPLLLLRLLLLLSFFSSPLSLPFPANIAAAVSLNFSPHPFTNRNPFLSRTLPPCARVRSPLLLASRTDPVESGALNTSDRPTRAPLNLTWQVPAEWTQSGPYTLLSRSHASLAYLACPSYPMPRRFSVSLTFSVLCLSMVLSSSRPMMAAIALACFMAQETQRAALSIIYGARHFAMTRSSARSLSLLSSLLPVSFSFT